MIKKQLLFSIIFLFFFCLTSLIAQTEKRKQPLIEILEKLHSQFECNFSYIDNDVRGIFVEPPDNKLNLNESIEYLQANTPLLFTILGSKFITITQKENTFSICGYLIDINTNETIEKVAIQTKYSSTISDEKGYFKLSRLTDEDIISFRHLGYKLFTEYAKVYNSNQCESIFL